MLANRSAVLLRITNRLQETRQPYRCMGDGMSYTDIRCTCGYGCSLIQTMDYRNRKVKLITKAEKGVMEQVLDRLLPLIAGDQYLSGIALSRTV